MLSNCGAGEDSWEFLRQQDQTNQSWRKSNLNVHWRDWSWSLSSNILAPWFEDQLIGKNPDAGKDWREEEKGTKENERVGWHHWTRVLANSRRMWRTGKPDVLQSMGSQRVGHDLPTEQQQLYLPTPLECDFPDCKTHVCYIEHCTLRLECCLENKRCSHIW